MAELDPVGQAAAHAQLYVFLVRGVGLSGALADALVPEWADAVVGAYLDAVTKDPSSLLDLLQTPVRRRSDGEFGFVIDVNEPGRQLLVRWGSGGRPEWIGPERLLYPV